jgi:hypothetical protein
MTTSVKDGSVKKQRRNPPPVHPDPELTSQIASKGAIGQALEQALEDLQAELLAPPIAASLASGEEHSKLPDGAIITPTAIHCIQEAFGRSVATTSHWEAAPAALMKGRLDHYNRFQGQWRIVVDSQSQVAPRPPNDKKRKESLFTGTDTVELTDKVQILVYNDL